MRTPKYNNDTRAKLLTLVRDGRTTKDACRLVGITDMTLSRWRKRYADFNAEYLKAIDGQWQNIENLKKDGKRTYRKDSASRRDGAKKKEEQRKIEQAVKEGEENGKPLVYDGLRIRYGDIEDEEPFTPCVDHRTGLVAYLKPWNGTRVQISLAVEVFKQRYPGWYRRLVEENAVYDVGD